MLQPAVGVLLRLGFACPLAIPVSCVLVINVSATTSQPHISVSFNDPVNIAAGNCSQVSAGSSSSISSRQLRSLVGSGTGSGDTVVVFLSVGFFGAAGRVCPRADDKGTSWGGGAGVSGGGGGGATASSLDAFIVAAGAAGISAEAASLICDAGSTGASVTSGSPPPPAPGIGVGAIVGAAVGGCLICALLLLLVLLRRRRSQKDKASSSADRIVIGPFTRGGDSGSDRAAAGGERNGRGDGTHKGGRLPVSNPVLHPRVRRQADQEARAADLRSLRFAANRGLSRRIKNEFGAMPAVLADDGPEKVDEEMMSTAASIMLTLSPRGAGRTTGSRAPSVDSTLDSPTAGQRASPIVRRSTALAGAEGPRRGIARVSDARSSPATASASSRTITVDADGTISPIFNDMRDLFARDAGASLRGPATAEATSARAASSLAAMQVYSAPIKPMLRRTVVLGSSTRAVVPASSPGDAREGAALSSRTPAVSAMQSNPLLQRRGGAQSSNRRLAALGGSSPARRGIPKPAT